MGSYCLSLLASLVVQRWFPREQLSLLFRLPRGTLLVMEATAMVQLTLASLVPRALPCGLDFVHFSFCLC